MSLDMNIMLNQMLSEFKKIVKDNSDEVVKYAQQAFEEEKDVLQQYVHQRFNGEIDANDFKFLVGQRKTVIENKLLASTVLSKAVIQKAVNRALNVLTKAVFSAATI